MNRGEAHQLMLACREDSDAYTVGSKLLGKGSFASVFLARRNSDGRKVVVKRIDRLTTKEQRKQVMAEILALHLAGPHPGLVTFHGWFQPPDGFPCIVLGYCKGGTLFSLLRGLPPEAAAQPDVLFTESQIMLWFVQLLLALDHMHGRRILHRDIKPQNIFMSKSRQFVKLGDLGVSAILENSQDFRNTVLGTPLYMSPELMGGLPYTASSDVWSLGCVLYEMAARRPTFDAFGLPQLIAKVVQNLWQPLPSIYSSPFRQLVSAMLRPDPAERPSTAKLLAMPYVRRHLDAFAAAYPGRLPGSAQLQGLVSPSILAGPTGVLMGVAVPPRTANRTLRLKENAPPGPGPTSAAAAQKDKERDPGAAVPPRDDEISHSVHHRASLAAAVAGLGVTGTAAPGIGGRAHDSGAMPDTDSPSVGPGQGPSRRSAWGSPTRRPPSMSEGPAVSDLSAARPSTSSKEQTGTVRKLRTASSSKQYGRQATAGRLSHATRHSSQEPTRPETASAAAAAGAPAPAPAPSLRRRSRVDSAPALSELQAAQHGRLQGTSSVEPSSTGVTALINVLGNRAGNVGPAPDTAEPVGIEAIVEDGQASQAPAGSRAAARLPSHLEVDPEPEPGQGDIDAGPFIDPSGSSRTLRRPAPHGAHGGRTLSKATGRKGAGAVAAKVALQTMTVHAKPRAWESAVGYEQEQKDLAQRRFQALQLSMRRTREQVRQKKRESDPKEQTRQLAQRQLVARRDLPRIEESDASQNRIQAQRYAAYPGGEPTWEGFGNEYVGHVAPGSDAPSVPTYGFDPYMVYGQGQAGLMQRALGGPLTPIQSVSTVASGPAQGHAGGGIMDYLSLSQTSRSEESSLLSLGASTASSTQQHFFTSTATSFPMYPGAASASPPPPLDISGGASSRFIQVGCGPGHATESPLPSPLTLRTAADGSPMQLQIPDPPAPEPFPQPNFGAAPSGAAAAPSGSDIDEDFDDDYEDDFNETAVLETGSAAAAPTAVTAGKPPLAPGAAAAAASFAGRNPTVIPYAFDSEPEPEVLILSLDSSGGAGRARSLASSARLGGLAADSPSPTALFGASPLAAQELDPSADAGSSHSESEGRTSNGRVGAAGSRPVSASASAGVAPAPAAGTQAGNGGGLASTVPAPSPLLEVLQGHGADFMSADVSRLLTELQKVWESDPSVRFALLRELWNMSLADSIGPGSAGLGSGEPSASTIDTLPLGAGRSPDSPSGQATVEPIQAVIASPGTSPSDLQPRPAALAPVPILNSSLGGSRARPGSSGEGHAASSNGAASGSRPSTAAATASGALPGAALSDTVGSMVSNNSTESSSTQEFPTLVGIMGPMNIGSAAAVPTPPAAERRAAAASDSRNGPSGASATGDFAFAVGAPADRAGKSVRSSIFDLDDEEYSGLVTSARGLPDLRGALVLPPSPVEEPVPGGPAAPILPPATLADSAYLEILRNLKALKRANTENPPSNGPHSNGGSITGGSPVPPLASSTSPTHASAQGAGAVGRSSSSSWVEAAFGAAGSRPASATVASRMSHGRPPTAPAPAPRSGVARSQAMDATFSGAAAAHSPRSQDGSGSSTGAARSSWGPVADPASFLSSYSHSSDGSGSGSGEQSSEDSDSEDDFDGDSSGESGSDSGSTSGEASSGSGTEEEEQEEETVTEDEADEESGSESSYSGTEVEAVLEDTWPPHVSTASAGQARVGEVLR